MQGDAAAMTVTKKLLVCTNFRANPTHPSCAARGSKLVIAALKLEKIGEIEIEESPCMGFCQVGPNCRLTPNGVFFHNVTANNLTEVIAATKKFML